LAPTPRATHTCSVCGEEFQRYPSRNRGEFVACSKHCSVVAGNWARAKRGYDAVRKMTEPERAWLAAAIDGEGCIGYVDTYPRITVVNTSLPFLQRAHDYTGVGRLAPRKKQKAHHQSQYSWTVDGYPALAVLEQIVDWLVIKQGKAATAMATKLDSLDNLAAMPLRKEG
jgi:hypothetical protein